MPRVLRIQRPFTPQDLEAGLRHPDESVRKGWIAVQCVSLGWDAAQIGAEIGWSVTWVRTRIRRFNKSGSEGLLDGRERNRKKLGLSLNVQQKLKTALEQKPPLFHTPWSGPLVARWLKEQENIHISDDTGVKWLHRLGYRVTPRNRKKSTFCAEEQQTPATNIPNPAASTVRREATSCAIGGTNLASPPDLPHRRAYPSDLTDPEWEIYKEFFKKEIEHPSRIYDVREIINAIMYVMRTGCQWRYLPHDFPPYNNVFNAFQRWERNGLLEKIHESTRDRLRKKSEREESPSLGIVDTQSVKTTEKGGSADMTEQRK